MRSTTLKLNKTSRKLIKKYTFTGKVFSIKAVLIYFQAKSSVAAFRNVLTTTPQLTNETRELLAAVVKSGELQIKYIEAACERLEPEQPTRRRKRDLNINPLYLVGDLADWTFGKDYIFIVLQ